MNLGEKFNLQEFTDWVEKFLHEFLSDFRKVDVPNGLSGVASINTLGESALGVRVFAIETEKDPSGRKIGLAKESFNLIKNYGTPNALIAYYSKESSKWRLSLLTSTPEWSQGKIITKLSNPKRQSYVLGQPKINTPARFLVTRGKVSDIADLKSRFSLEVVNKDFYKEISKAFTKLSSGLLKLPSVQDKSQTNAEFAVRLIGRIIFCWFLREKNGYSTLPLMPKEVLSLEAVNQNENYYHKILEPIFFEVLNKPIKLRKDEFSKEPFSSVPYLNGGLFTPQDDDFYKRSNGDLQSQFNNTLVVPDNWFKEFFETLETYNFTIDENTSFDEELSIDPEMLGRIFENLLAEMNPETGESARKATGSYYTPRTIVNYMVDESLLLYLRQKTNIDEGKLRAIISYDLTDDPENQISKEEKGKIIDALETLKLLDPACGSGAFPIGALQKIVFILQQIDPDGQLWFKKQLIRTSPELRRVIEREFEHQNFDYIRKLGIIRENIYGIDIQPIATEISRLRCFLTLIVDERVQDDLENRGIEPLPNLDFKFVTANSLIGLPTSRITNQMGLFEDGQGINELKELRDMFFTATGVEREQLKLQFVQAQNRMFQRMIEGGTKGYADLTTRLSGWDPFNHKASTWFDPEWMFGAKERFDVVIANPPYGATIDKNDLVLIKKRLIDTKNTNSAAIFIDFAKNSFLNEEGILSYIVPKSLLYSEQWFDLVKKLIGKVTVLVDVEKAFENVLLEQVVFVFGKSVSTEKYLAQKFLNDEFLRSTQINNEAVMKFKAWLCDVTENELKIASKVIENNSTELLGSVSTTKRGVGLQKYLKSYEAIPVIGGKNIIRYGLNGFKGYLSEKDFASNRLKVSFMKQPKIVSQNIVAHIQNPHPHLMIIASYDDKGNVLALDTVNNTVLKVDYFNPKYILAIMNSTLISWFAYKFIYCAAIRTMHFDSNYVGKIPIIRADNETQKQLVDVVDKITAITNTPDYSQNTSKKTQVKDYEKQINELVYKLYDLTPGEITVVEGGQNTFAVQN